MILIDCNQKLQLHCKCKNKRKKKKEEKKKKTHAIATAEHTNVQRATKEGEYEKNERKTAESFLILSVLCA